MQLVYEAGVVGAANVSFVITKRNIEYRSERVYSGTQAAAIGIDWASAAELDVSMHDLQRTPDSVPEGQGPYFGVVPDSINTAGAEFCGKAVLGPYLLQHAHANCI